MTQHQTFKIGDTLPSAMPRQILTGPEGPPVWHCVTTLPQAEAKTREYLRARDVYAFFPSENRTRHRLGKQIEVERPYIPGMVYAQFRHTVQWDVLKARRIIRGVMCRGAVPVAIHPDVIRHLQGLTVEAERLEQARIEMSRVREGDRATIITGALAGLCVEVGQITGSEAWLQLPFGGRIKASITSLERMQEPRYIAPQDAPRL